MKIYEKIKNGDYETKLPYPQKPLMTCKHCGINNAHNNGRISKFCPNCGLNIKDDYDYEMEKFNQNKLDYNHDRLKLNARFKADALYHCVIDNHKKADKAWNIAWNERTSYNEKVDFLEELAELIVS